MGDALVSDDDFGSAETSKMQIQLMKKGWGKVPQNSHFDEDHAPIYTSKKFYNVPSFRQRTRAGTS